MAVIFGIVITLILIAIFWGNVPKLEEWIMIVVLVSTIVVGIISISLMRRIKIIMPVFRDFMSYLIFVDVFILFAALFEFLEIFPMTVNISEIQVEYLAHFPVFIALSALILGLEKLFHLPGVYAKPEEISLEK